MKQYKDTDYFYDILDNGYDIYTKTTKIIEQHDPFGKVFAPDKTYEENCLIQLEQMVDPPQPEPGPYEPSLTEKNRADLDYMALMLDVTLPSEEEE